MIVRRLKLANVRAIQAAEFRFQPGFNLIVGINGVGKTSVLDALGVCLSAVVKRSNKLRSPIEAFDLDDIRVGADMLTVECGVKIDDREYEYLVHKPRETSVSQKSKSGMPREQVIDTPTRAEFIGDTPKPVSGKEPGGRPMALLFSTRRAVPSERSASTGAAAQGILRAFADAFSNRELRLGEFADWMRVQQELLEERPAAARALAAFEEATVRFLPSYSNLRLGGEDRRQLMISRGKSEILVRQLSDGERGMLALVLDLTRRLSQANPNLEDPAAEAEAVVLIDEIDLHLHPKWQRQIVQNLQDTFPRCQFIATTHSPQVIGEVEHQRIQIISEGEIYSPTHSYGIDSSRVLEEIMDADRQSKEVSLLISEVSRAIGKQQLVEARQLLSKLIARLELGENDPEVSRLRTLIDFMEGNE
ncbi:MAG: AAA family ATPase [Syntrophobacteraceae bacterium]